MESGYVELQAKSFYSFGVGASHPHELLAQAKEYGYSSLALTDTNLCGALEFARLANSLGIRPITGGELTLDDGSRVTLLAKTRKGYSNISRLFTLANAVDRREPRLDPGHLAAHAEGVILLTGGRDSCLARLALGGQRRQAAALLQAYAGWYGRDSVYVALQQNFLQGDTMRNSKLAGVAEEAGIPLAVTNDVHYHTPERYRLQNALVAIRHNTTIDQALPHLRPNDHLYLKPPAEMARLFGSFRRLSPTPSASPSAALSISAPIWGIRCRSLRCRKAIRLRAISNGSVMRRRRGVTARCRNGSQSGWKRSSI